MRPRLIVNADDFGLTPGINQAVIELHRAGTLSSTSLMATGEAFDEAAAIARENPILGVGCHLVFVDGNPVSDADDIPGLVDPSSNGFRPSLLSFAHAVTRGAVPIEEVRREAEAQLGKLLRAGVNVTHLDTHKHVHCLPKVRAIVMDLARRYRLGLRHVYEPGWSVAVSRAGWQRRFKTRVVGALGKSPGMDTEGTLGIAATGTLDIETLRAMLGRLPEDSLYELCCHPGYPDEALARTRTRLVETRDIERKALLEVVPEFALELVDYRCSRPIR